MSRKSRRILFADAGVSASGTRQRDIIFSQRDANEGLELLRQTAAIGAN